MEEDEDEGNTIPTIFCEVLVSGIWEQPFDFLVGMENHYTIITPST